MIKHLFTLHRNDGGYANVTPSGHSRADMWHDLAEKVASLDRQAESDTFKIEFVDDVSIDD